MANKALKIVGIGCGALALLAAVGMGVAGYWAKGKMKGMTEWSEKLERQNKELSQLDEKYAFTLPPKGQPVTLAEERLEKYLSIRSGLTPVMDKYNKEAKKFEGKDQQASLSDAMAAAGMMGGLMAELREAFIENLKKNEMSPREFHATTAAIYTAHVGQANVEIAKVQTQALTEQIREYEEELAKPDLQPEGRQQLEEGLAQARTQLAEVSRNADKNSAGTEIHAANAALIAKHKERIDKMENIMLDGVLSSGDSDWSDAFDRASGN